MAKTEADERLNRALTAFLRQEVQAPASAVTDFLDMIIEEAPEGLLADLNRMRTASVQLNAFVKSLIRDSASDRGQDEAPEAFHRRLRHDLRTPLGRLRQGLEDAKIRAASRSDYEQAIDHAVEEADALLNTFTALLRIAQIEAGAQRAAFRMVDLSNVMRTVTEAYGPVAEDGGRSTSSRFSCVADAFRLTSTG